MQDRDCILIVSSMLSYMSYFSLPSHSTFPMVFLPLARQSPPLHLRQSSAPTHESHEAHHSGHRQGLEEVPAGVVHEEHSLHSHHTPKEQSMRYRRISKRLACMIRVRTQVCPSTQQHRQRAQHYQREYQTDDLRRRARVIAENVVDLLFRTVAFGCGRCGDGGAVGLDGEVEDVLLVGRGRAERGEDEACAKRFGGCKELVREVFL